MEGSRRVKDIKAGQHLIEGRQVRFKPQRATVRLAGRDNPLWDFRLKLEPAADDRPRGSSDPVAVPRPEVFARRSSIWRAPVERRDLDPGKHYISCARTATRRVQREISLVENDPGHRVRGRPARSAGLSFLSTPRRAGQPSTAEPIATDVADSTSRRRRRRSRRRFSWPCTSTARQTSSRRRKSCIVAADLKLAADAYHPERSCARIPLCRPWGGLYAAPGRLTADFGLGYPTSLRAAHGRRFRAQAALVSTSRRVPSFIQMNTLAVHGPLSSARGRPGRWQWPCAPTRRSGPAQRQEHRLPRRGGVASLAFAEIGDLLAVSECVRLDRPVRPRRIRSERRVPGRLLAIWKTRIQWAHDLQVRVQRD